MSDPQNEAERKLQVLSEVLNQSWAKLHRFTDKHREAIRQGVNAQWKQEETIRQRMQQTREEAAKKASNDAVKQAHTRKQEEKQREEQQKQLDQSHKKRQRHSF